MFEEQEYEIEKILAAEFSKSRNRFFYLVKWVNWPIEASTWEPEENFSHSLDLLNEFKAHFPTNHCKFNWQSYPSLRYFWVLQSQQPQKRRGRPRKYNKQNPVFPLHSHKIDETKHKKIHKPNNASFSIMNRKKKKEIIVKQIDSDSSSSDSRQFQVVEHMSSEQAKLKIKTGTHTQFINKTQQPQPNQTPTPKQNKTAKKNPKQHNGNMAEQSNEQENKIRQITKCQQYKQHTFHSSQIQPERSKSIQPTQQRRYQTERSDIRMEEVQSDSGKEDDEEEEEYVCEEDYSDDDEYSRCAVKSKLNKKYNFIDQSKLSKNIQMFESPFHEKENSESHLNFRLFDDLIENARGNPQKKEEEPNSPNNIIPKTKVTHKNASTQCNFPCLGNYHHENDKKSLAHDLQASQSPQIKLNRQRYKILGIRRSQNQQNQYNYSVMSKQSGLKSWMTQAEVFESCPLSLIQYYENRIRFDLSGKAAAKKQFTSFK